MNLISSIQNFISEKPWIIIVILGIAYIQDLLNENSRLLNQLERKNKK